MKWKLVIEPPKECEPLPRIINLILVKGEEKTIVLRGRVTEGVLNTIRQDKVFHDSLETFWEYPEEEELESWQKGSRRRDLEGLE